MSFWAGDVVQNMTGQIGAFEGPDGESVFFLKIVTFATRNLPAICAFF